MSDIPSKLSDKQKTAVRWLAANRHGYLERPAVLAATKLTESEYDRLMHYLEQSKCIEIVPVDDGIYANDFSIEPGILDLVHQLDTPTAVPAAEVYQPAAWERRVVYSMSVLFFGLVCFVVVRNQPFADRNIVVLVRLVLALAIASLGATVPGFLHVGISFRGVLIRAGGALALFVLCLFVTPQVLDLQAAPSTRPTGRNAQKHDSSQSIEFQQIEIDERASQWTAIKRPYVTGDADTNLNRSPFMISPPPIGKPRNSWPMGTHQVPDHLLDGSNTTLDRTTDPIFSVVLTNVTDQPVTLTAIGFVPVAAWTALKGAPCVMKLKEFDAISIVVKGFDPLKTQMHVVDPPVSIGPQGSYRIKLRLVEYNRATKHNESAIRFVAEANQLKFYSADLYLGLCESHDK